MIDRIALCLEYLAPHVAPDAVAITGGVAIGRDAHDLDLVIARRDAIAATVCESFLVNHYHPTADKLVLQLVDARARIHIDIFFDALGTIANASLGENGWLVLDDDDLLDHKLELLARASAASPVDPKHVEDARVLAKRLLRPPPIEPEPVQPTVYSTDVTVRCTRCAEDEAFVLAAKTEIFAILGYV